MRWHWHGRRGVPRRISDQLELEGATISPSMIWRVLHRLGLGTCANRLLVLEMHSARSAGLLTERTRRNLARRKVRHVQAEKPGELVYQTGLSQS